MSDNRLTTAVAIIGTVLTAGSLFSSYFQYKAADLQAKAAVVALMPQIQVRALLHKGESERYSDQILEIESDGGPVYDFRADRRTWFEVQKGQEVFRQPLIGYFFADYPTGRIKGELQVTTGYRNNERYIRLHDALSKKLGPEYQVSRPITLLRVDYSDALRQSLTEYFEVSGGRAVRIPLVRGGRPWEDADKRAKSVRTFELGNVDAPGALDELSKTIERNLLQVTAR